MIYGSFEKCSALEFLDLPLCAASGAYGFFGCKKLKTLVLRSEKIFRMDNINCFSETPFRNGEGGTVYVPQALVESYKTATNWNAMESVTFLPIEGSEYE
jgi:hypothetical protein